MLQLNKTIYVSSCVLIWNTYSRYFVTLEQLKEPNILGIYNILELYKSTDIRKFIFLSRIPYPKIRTN